MSMEALDETRVRREKLERLRAAGVNPYPLETDRDATCAEALEHFDAWSASGETVTLAGRLMTIRVHGAMIFADLADASGKLQIALKEDHVDAQAFQTFRDDVDPGDIVEATGTLFATKRGEKTLSVKQWKLLTKALLPLPEKFHGLKDVELRYRERELDLLANPESRERALTRSRLVASLRRYLDARDFLEVETPILQPIPGGANARPFVTHHHALDADFYLRIAPEIYLKRLIVGGFEKVYEIARCFRNEGIDHAHNPEFTQIELYWAYAGKERFLSFIEEMLTTVIRESFGTLSVTETDFKAPWPRMTFREAILSACGIDIDCLKSREDVLSAVRKADVSVDFGNAVGLDEYLDELYKKTARQKIVQPTWVLDYPVEMMALANRSPDDPTKSATAQLVVAGTEVIKVFYYELNDPVEQRLRLEEQQKLHEQGSETAQQVDEAFLRALEHGMPPTSGFGMGIDRLVSLLTGAHNLKEVILFPTLRPTRAS